ncbi:MAG: hypothetical protein AAFV78_08740, partial [Bacteroidota bacterium]
MNWIPRNYLPLLPVFFITVGLTFPETLKTIIDTAFTPEEEMQTLISNGEDVLKSMQIGEETHAALQVCVQYCKKIYDPKTLMYKKCTDSCNAAAILRLEAQSLYTSKERP